MKSTRIEDREQYVVGSQEYVRIDLQRS